MIQTITQENYTKGSEQKTGILFADVNLISFLNKDNSIVVYFNIGEVLTVMDEVIQEEETIYSILITRTLKFTDEEMKTRIEGTGIDFNSPVTNLLISEMNKFVDDLILKDIEINPSNYFGLTVDKWNKA
jgi:hypothetical protein